jgi:hypothetical protein
MPRRPRTRTRTSRSAAVLAAGAMAGLPLLPASAAVAAPPEISFSRSGLGLLTCNSRPSDHDLVVPAGTTVRFVNDLGEDATLRIDGQEATGVARGESSEVLFRRGTVRIQLVPSCGLSLSSAFEAVAVTVAAPGGASSSPPSRAPVAPVAPGGGSSTGSAGATGSTGGRDTGSLPGAGRDREDGSSSGGSSAGRSVPAAPSGAPADQPGESGDQVGDQGVAAEPLSPPAASGEGGPNGLLAIIAIVCVAGVSTGAIRAIFAQRATRTRTA